MATRKRLVVVGGGTGGLSVLRALHRKRKDLDITLVEPRTWHAYQPLWTLVGAGIFPMAKSERSLKSFLPSDVRWIKERVMSFDPEHNRLELESKTILQYDLLIVAPGIQLDWHLIEGLPETLGKNGVCSNYSEKHVSYTWQVAKTLKSGRAIFTQPATPIKCAGAPQKAMYLSEETFRMNGVRKKVEVHFMSAGPRLFGVQKYREALEKVVKSRGIQTHFQRNLIKVDGEKHVATFKDLQSGELHQESFTMLHVVPPMSAPDFIKRSPLANADGWVDVHKHTLVHNRYANIFALGDASSLPTSRTGAAIRKQGPVLVDHLIARLEGRTSTASYNGYASCPLVTSRGKAILAEFDYDGNPDETFPFDQGKERWSMYMLKKHFIPYMYWNAMMRGYF